VNNENSNLLDCSVIIPAFGQSHLLCETISETQKILEQQKLNYEIIIIDDHSPTGILEQVKHCLNERIKIYRLGRNTGQLIATIIGMKLSKGNVIITIDDDMQYNPQYIPDGFAKLQGGFSIIYGTDKNEKWSVNKTYKNLASVLMFPRFINYDVTSFRIIDRSTLKDYTEIDVIGRFWKLKNSMIGEFFVLRRKLNPRPKTIIGLFKHQSFFLSSFLKRLLLMLILFAVFFKSYSFGIIGIFVAALIAFTEYSIAKRLQSPVQRLFP